jgi:hypothetical protein
MPVIVYRNTGMFSFSTFPFPSKQKPLIHWLLAPFYTVLALLFRCRLPQTLVFKDVRGKQS